MIEPTSAETEYGYILPDRSLREFHAGAMASEIRFVEKPDASSARDLIRQGALWNTMALVFHTATFLPLVDRTLPGIMSCFVPIDRALGTSDEKPAVREAYTHIVPLGLSKDLFESPGNGNPCKPTVLAVRGVTWSDWVSGHRIPGATHPTAAWHEEDQHGQDKNQRKQQDEGRKENS